MLHVVVDVEHLPVVGQWAIAHYWASNCCSSWLWRHIIVSISNINGDLRRAARSSPCHWAGSRSTRRRLGQGRSTVLTVAAASNSDGWLNAVDWAARRHRPLLAHSSLSGRALRWSPQAAQRLLFPDACLKSPVNLAVFDVAIISPVIPVFNKHT